MVLKHQQPLRFSTSHPPIVNEVSSIAESQPYLVLCDLISAIEMNPNAAAFALILKQRENLNANAAAPGSGVTPFAPPGATSNAFAVNSSNQAHNYPSPFQPPVPFGARPPHPGMIGGGQSFMNAMSYAYPSAFPMNPVYPQYNMPNMYSAPVPYPPVQGYPMQMPIGNNYYPNAVSHTQLPPGQQPNFGRTQKTNQNKFKKPAAPAAPAPVAESGLWYCEPCDKEFTQLGPFEAHKATHETCWHPGCAFNATRKVVQAHFHGSHGQFSGSGYKMIDVEGQKFRVLMGQSPEEIAQWRAERRKKFPTAEVEEAKKKELAELVEAGGVVPKSVGKTNRKRDLEGAGGEKLGKKARSKEDGKSEVSGDEGDASVEGGGEGSTEGNDPPVPGVRRCYQYGRGKCQKGVGCPFSHDFEPKMCAFFLRGHCRQGFKCNNIHDSEARKEHRANNPPTPRSKGEEGAGAGASPKEKKSAAPKKPPMMNKNGELSIPEPLSGGARGTLWRKLLEDEIYKEENIVLQCLRFLVQNNFLEGVEEA